MGWTKWLFRTSRASVFVFFYRRVFFWRNLSVPPGVRLRLALENLGPIFIKFGQMLSTRRDLLPGDIADELSKLQDRVPPFDSNVAVEQITRYLGAPPEELFASFDRIPVASASVAQVLLRNCITGMRLPSRYCALKCKSGSVVTSN